MTNEEFQRLVLEKLGALEQGQNDLRQEVNELKQEINGVKQELNELKQELNEVKQTVNSIAERIVDLIEFKTEITQEMNTLIEDNKSSNEILGEHEVSIRTLRRMAI